MLHSGHVLIGCIVTHARKNYLVISRSGYTIQSVTHPYYPIAERGLPPATLGVVEPLAYQTLEAFEAARTLALGIGVAEAAKIPSLATALPFFRSGHENWGGQPSHGITFATPFDLFSITGIGSKVSIEGVVTNLGDDIAVHGHLYTTLELAKRTDHHTQIGLGVILEDGKQIAYELMVNILPIESLSTILRIDGTVCEIKNTLSQGHNEILQVNTTNARQLGPLPIPLIHAIASQSLAEQHTAVEVLKTVDALMHVPNE